MTEIQPQKMRQRNPIPLDLPKEGFAYAEQAANALAVSKSTFLRRVREGMYPAPIKFGRRCTRWKVEDIRAFIASQ